MKLLQFTMMVCVAIGLVGCQQEVPPRRPSVCTIALDKHQVEVDVTPETKYVEIKFHDNGYILQDDEFLELGLFLDVLNSTAELNKHYSIMSMSLGGWVSLSYNLSLATGNMIIQLYPENITKELVLVMKTPNEKEKLFVTLRPISDIM